LERGAARDTAKLDLRFAPVSKYLRFAAICGSRNCRLLIAFDAVGESAAVAAGWTAFLASAFRYPIAEDIQPDPSSLQGDPSMSARRAIPMLVSMLSLGLTAFSAADEKPTSIPGVGPTGKISKLHTDFKFTEGPAADRDGNVYFSDIPNERIHKSDTDGKLSLFRAKTNRANGLMVNAKGEIVACEMAGQVVAYSADGKSRRVLAGKYHGKRFNAPNDLVLDKHGGVYFTDPAFGAPMPLPQGKTAVYYIAAGGEVTRLIDDLPNPNGVILSPDEKTLYVIPSGQAQMMAYPVEGAGKIGTGRVFCTLKQRKEGGKSGGDGLTVDVKGNLYITSDLGLQVFDAGGKLLVSIR
jgi:gluconolactonase